MRCSEPLMRQTRKRNSLYKTACFATILVTELQWKAMQTMSIFGTWLALAFQQNRPQTKDYHLLTLVVYMCDANAAWAYTPIIGHVYCKLHVGLPRLYNVAFHIPHSVTHFSAACGDTCVPHRDRPVYSRSLIS